MLLSGSHKTLVQLLYIMAVGTQIILGTQNSKEVVGPLDETHGNQLKFSSFEIIGIMELVTSEIRVVYLVLFGAKLQTILV